MTLTGYIVLAREDGNGWRVLQKVAARSADAAIREVAERTSDGGGTFVAVPERSWAPKTVAVEVRKQLSLAPAVEVDAG